MTDRERNASEGGRVADALAVPTELGERIGRLVDRFGDAASGTGLDALVVTDLLNVRYLTGFAGGAATLVVTDEGATLVTDGRYGVIAAETTTSGIAVEVTDDGGRTAVTSAVGDRRRIGLEADEVSWSRMRTFADDWFAGRDIVATTRLVEELRFVKDSGELARITAACALADEVLDASLPLLRGGPTELEFQRHLDEQMAVRGSEEPAFPTIVASGPNAALPHHRPDHRTIGAGDAVLIDFGGTVDGYRSDVSRTVGVGDVGPELEAIHALVLEAQLAGLAAVGDGVPAAEVDRAARSVIEAAGRAEHFTHSTGHGVGLFIHEDPWVSWRSDDVLRTHHTVTIEPGIYVPGLGGVRIEDLVVVTADGHRVLTRTPTALTRIG